MASTIITKNSSTASAVPVVGDLTKGELAVNVTDKKIYTKDNSAAVVKLVGSLGNQEANAVAITGGSIAGITDLAVADGGTGASTASDARTNLGLGTIATQAASSVTITGGSVTGITDITVADGGTGASTAANARTNLGAAASGANSDITSLSGLTTALSVAQGGTGITSFGSGVATFLGTPSSANLASAVTDETGSGALVFANTPTLVAPILGTPTSGNFSSGSFTWPTFNQNTTGTAAGLSATLAIASGGTGATTAGGALTSLGAYAASNPSGYTSNTGTVTSVGGTGTVNGLTLTGTVTTSGNLTLGGTLSGVSLTSQVSGTLPTANGGTGLTSFTSGGVVYASSSSALATSSQFAFDGTNVKIGVHSFAPNTNLAGNLLQLKTAGGIAYLTMGNGDGANQTNYIGSASDVTVFGSVTDAGATTERMRLTSTGLGIGTSSPAQKLDVSGSGTVSGRVSSTSGNATFILNSASSFFNYLQFSSAGTSGLIFYDATNTADRMAITSAGNVGIGTSSPATQLEIKSAAFTDSQITLDNTSSNTTSRVLFKAAGTEYGRISGDSTQVTLQSGNIPIVFRTNSAERMRLDSAGNLGLGVTPSAWEAGYQVLENSGGSFFSGSGSVVRTVQGGYINSGYKYKYTSVAAGLYAINAGAHEWSTAASGTAGNAISFTQAMTLSADARLYVGTTTESGTNDSRAIFKTDDASGVYRCLALETTVTTSRSVQTFRNGNGQVGDIALNGTATAYNTSSDYRLKNITGPLTTSGAYIDSLNPVEGTWKADGSTFVGLIAHEVQEASRTQVATGTKDGAEMQSMDYSNSELIANLIAEVKSLRQRVATLEAQ